MTRYFFHLHECGTATLDDEGVERDNLSDVKAEAIRAARDVMCSEVRHGRLCLGCHIEVTDVQGSTVLKVPFREAVEVTGLA